MNDSKFFEYTFTVRLHDTDAAGIMFFARAFYHIHDAYEDFLTTAGLSVESILKQSLALPISDVSAKYIRPLMLNEKIKIRVTVENIENNTFKLHHEFSGMDGKTRIMANSQHHCIDRSSGKKTTFPASLFGLLSEYLKK